MVNDEDDDFICEVQPFIAGLYPPALVPRHSSWDAEFETAWWALHSIYLADGEVVPTWLLRQDDQIAVELCTPICDRESKRAAITFVTLAIAAINPIAVTSAAEFWLAPHIPGESDEEYRARLNKARPSEQPNRAEFVGLVTMYRDENMLRTRSRYGVPRRNARGEVTDLIIEKDEWWGSGWVDSMLRKALLHPYTDDQRQNARYVLEYFRRMEAHQCTSKSPARGKRKPRKR